MGRTSAAQHGQWHQWWNVEVRHRRLGAYGWPFASLGSFGWDFAYLSGYGWAFAYWWL